MFSHETAWANIPEQLQWPWTPVSSADVSSPIDHQKTPGNTHSLNDTSDQSHIPLTPSHSMCPLDPLVRQAYQNINTLPFTPETPKFRLGGALPPNVSQDCSSSGYIIPDASLIDRGVGNDFGVDNLLDGLPGLPDHDHSNHSEEALNSEGVIKKGPNAPPVPLTLDTGCSYPSLSSPFSCTTGSFDLSDRSAYSEAPSYSPDFTPSSSFSFSYTPLSPAPSPGFPRTDVVHGGCPSRAIQTARPKVRAAPYALNNNRKRAVTWSSTPRIPESSAPHLRSPSCQMHQMSPSTVWAAPQHETPGSVIQLENNGVGDNPSSDAHQGKLPITQNECDIRYLERYFNLPGPPDLLGHLNEEPSCPPKEDMNPEDPTMIPREQEVRFQNDLYTPRWVRGQGNKREGWCGLCKPGRWLVLKNSAFWYDKCFSHGISSATGQAFMAPKEMRRVDGNTNAWEGLCGICGKWVSLVSSKKKRTTWFRHAYKCHQSIKPTEGLKSSRGNSFSINCFPTEITEFDSLHGVPSGSKATVAGFNCFNYLEGGSPLIPQTSFEAIASLL